MENRIEEGVFRTIIGQRQRRGLTMQRLYAASFGVAILALVLLALTIINQAFGFVTVVYRIEPETVSEIPVADLDEAGLIAIMVRQQPGQLARVVAEVLSPLPTDQFARTPLGQSLPGRYVPEAYLELSPADIPSSERPQVMGEILSTNLDRDQVFDIVERVVFQPTISETWPLFDGLLNSRAIQQSLVERFPDEITRPELRFKAWLRPEILTVAMDSNPLVSGIRTALIGTLYLVVIVVVTAFPVGIAAAIYLEEYANPEKWYNRLIETNIRNLAGVPSIIYGLLGLQLLVRFMGDPATGGLGITSGHAFGIIDGTGRNIITAGLTLGLLVLPVVIINAQEAIRAVPFSYREASFGLGATKWQTIWRQVLPAALPGIFTGIILSLSRAVGETAPLVVVGASTFIVQNPTVFSRFTALPIQIYTWTSRPQAGFRELASATIIVLLVLLIAINLVVFVMRNQARRRLQS